MSITYLVVNMRMRANELYELMDRPADWTEVDFHPQFAIVEFLIQEKRYTVIIHVHDVQHMIANISFSLERKGKDRMLGHMDQTGTGDSFAVYGTVSAILLAYIKKMNLQGVSFSANSAGKRKLYNRLAERLGRLLNWPVLIDGSHYSIGLNDHDVGE